MPTRLAKLNLDTSRPGFYDDAAFLAAERGDPKLLEAYAGFVDGLTLDQDYFKYARERVRETASFLLKELKADGRQGACIDLASAVSRFLERQGVWNYLVRGALTLSFPASSGLSSKHFWPIGNGPSASGATAAHVWVRAQPFVVVDLTVAMQPYSEGAECFPPDAVIAENAPRGKVGLSDLLDPEAREELRYRLHREPKLDDVRLVNPGLLDRIARLGVWDLQHDGTQMRYVACAVTAPDAPMETAKNLRLSGKFMIDLWNEFERAVRPPLGQ